MIIKIYFDFQVNNPIRSYSNSSSSSGRKRSRSRSRNRRTRRKKSGRLDNDECSDDEDEDDDVPQTCPNIMAELNRRFKSEKPPFKCLYCEFKTDKSIKDKRAAMIVLKSHVMSHIDECKELDSDEEELLQGETSNEDDVDREVSKLHGET